LLPIPKAVISISIAIIFVPTETSQHST